MNDLEEVAMDALDRQEQQDEQPSDDNQENAVEGSESDSKTDDVQNGSDTQDEQENGSDGEVEGDNDESDGEDNEEPENKSEEDNENDKKQELSDEEFEELAKKRGYSKKSYEDKQKESEEAGRKAFDNATKRPKEVDRDTWEAMPPINKVIYNNLPYIQAVGKDGNIVKVKTAQQLPDDFEFANKKSEMQFQNDLQAQEMKAQRMSDAINERISQNKQRQQSANEARAILSEIDSLQKSGDLPTPKAKPGTKEFDSDDAVVLINKVLGYRQERLKAGSNISVEDALTIYRAKHPDEFKSKSEAKGDAERKKVANKISGNNKAADTSTTKKTGGPKYYKWGMSTEDVLDRALDEMDD